MRRRRLASDSPSCPCGLRVRRLGPASARLLLAFLALSCVATAGPAAPPAEEPWERERAFSARPEEVLRAAAAVPAVPDDEIVSLLEEIELTYDSEARAVERYRYAFRVDGSSDGWDTVSATYAPWYQERPEIRARVVTADGKEHRLDPATIGEFALDSEEPVVLSDRRRLRAPLPALAAGAVAEVEIVTRNRRTYFEHASSFGMVIQVPYPVRRYRIVVDAPADLPLKWSVRGFEGAAPNATVDGRRRRVVLDLRDVPAFEEPEPSLPADMNRVRSFQVTTGTSWAELAAEYGATVDGALAGSDLSGLVAEATAGATTRPEKIARLVAALHRKVRYTGLEFGQAAIVPRAPGETLKRGYGDCKDKATVLVGLLRQAGIPAHVALLSTGPGADVDPALPATGEFDHAIVFVPGEPPLWIDATVPEARVGQLPLPDQGRLALVAAPSTTGLSRTMQTTSADNRTVETRAVTLAESGRGRVLETTEAWGSYELNYRLQFEGEDESSARESLTDYVKRTYGAEALGTVQLSPVEDLAIPFRLQLEALRVEKATTAQDEATVEINPWTLLSELRGALGYESSESETPVRRSDLVLWRPHRATWNYVITPPPGYTASSLPERSETKLGPALLTSTYDRQPDGTVHATLTVDSGPARWTAAEVNEAYAALRRIGDGSIPTVHFEQAGEALLAAGKIAEALAEFRQLATAAPASPGPPARLSRALVEAGIGDAAVEQARRAVALAPDSAIGYAALGWALQHDAIGRRFGGGWDRAGALAAMRRAKELDPSNFVVRGDLAILLEYDATGQRYSPSAQVGEAIAEYQAIRTELGNHGLDKNLMAALARSGRIAELRALTESLEATTDNTAWRLVAIALESGPPAALQQAKQLWPRAADRNPVLLQAGGILVLMRCYPQARPLLSEAASAAPDPQQVRALLEMMSRVKRHEDVKLDAEDPRAPVLELLRAQLAPQIDLDALSRVHVSWVEPLVKPAADWTATALRARLRFIEEQGLEREAIIDLAWANSDITVTGDAATVQRVRLNFAQEGKRAMVVVYVRRERGAARILAYEGSAAFVGTAALRLLDAGDAPTAQLLLDWTRQNAASADRQSVRAIDMFQSFWHGEPAAGAEVIRVAAAALLVTTESDREAIPILTAARRGVSGPEHEKYDVALLIAYASRGQLAELEKGARELYAAFPGVDFSSMMLGEALYRQGRWDELGPLVNAWLKRSPDSTEALFLKSAVEAVAGRYDESEKILRRLAAQGPAAAQANNNLAWWRVLRGAVDAEAVECAQRAVALEPSAATRHTLAAALAEAGRPVEARDQILQAIDLHGGLEPASEDWYVLGRIAESYGERGTAIEWYRRVGSTRGSPREFSTETLARRRLAALTAPEAAKTVEAAR